MTIVFILFKLANHIVLSSITADFTWILRSGEYILKNHFIPQTDIFSWTLANKNWVLYQWLFEALIALGNNVLGLSLLIKIHAILTFFIYIALPLYINQRKKIPFIFSLIICTFSLYAAICNFTLRPMIFTSLFLSLQYILIKYFYNKKYTLFILSGIYILWANLHTGVFLGLISLLLLLIARKTKYNKKTIIDSSKYILICFASSLINPYTYKIYTYLYNLSSQTFLNNIIAELNTPNFHQISPLIFFIFFIIFILLPKKFFSRELYLQILVFSIATFYSGRFIVWSVLFMSFALPSAIYKYYKTIDLKTCEIFLQSKLLNSKNHLYILSILFLSFIIYSQPSLKGECREFSKAIKYYLSYTNNSINNRILNDEIIGSCLILENNFKDKVFLDSRFDFYETDFVRSNRQFLMGYNTKNYLNKWQPNFIFVKNTWTISNILQFHKEYKLIYKDNLASIFEKQN